MIGSLLRLLQHRLATRAIAIAISVVFMSGLAALGPVGKAADTTPASASESQDPTIGPGEVGPDGSTSPSPKDKKKGKKKKPGLNTPTVPPPITPDQIPDFGLLDQGVTDDYVKVGISYNVSQCGDAAQLAQLLGPAGGNPRRAIDAFVSHINDTGGIGGREYRPVIVDDGGTCTEKNIAAAIQMLEEDKVFLAIPGLHVESDYLIARKLPVFGGREDPASLAKYGPNGLMLLEPIGPAFDAWASFGRHYLETQNHQPCLIRPENGASGNWDVAEAVLHEKMRKHGLQFSMDTIVYEEKVESAQKQSNAIAARAKRDGCDQVWFMAGNPIALIFFTKAATQNRWNPTWTWNPLMVEADQDYAGRLMDRPQWNRAYGLSTRVPTGEHPSAGKCAEIYRRYNGEDGSSTSAATNIACAQILTTAEIMRRAVKLTGTLSSDTLLLGANGITNDFFYDGHVPMDFSIPDADGPFKTRGFSHYTVVKWNEKAYTFPEYPCYYRLLGPSNGGCEDLRRYFT